MKPVSSAELVQTRFISDTKTRQTTRTEETIDNRFLDSLSEDEELTTMRTAFCTPGAILPAAFYL